MPSCCRCNGNGICLNCVCRKSGRKCTSCLPKQKNQCKNDVSDVACCSAPSSSSCSSRKCGRKCTRYLPKQKNRCRNDISKIPSCSAPSSHSCTTPLVSSRPCTTLIASSRSYVTSVVSSRPCTTPIPSSSSYTTSVASSHPCTTPLASSSSYTTSVAPSRPCTTPIPSSSSYTTSVAPSHPCTTPIPSSSSYTTSVAPSHPCTTPLASSSYYTTSVAPSHPCTTPIPSSSSYTTSVVSSHPCTTLLASFSSYTTSVASSHPCTTLIPSSSLCTTSVASSHPCTTLIALSSSCVTSVASSHDCTTHISSSCSCITSVASPHSCTTSLSSSHSCITPLASSDSTAIDSNLSSALVAPNTEAQLNQVRDLPSFRPMICDKAQWHNLNGQEFVTLITSAYQEIVHWKPNHFMIPSGAQGKHFVNKLVHLLNAFATESPLESFAITAAMTMPALLLQKPHARSKSKDHIKCLSRRLHLWETGDIKELLHEGRIIQAHLSKQDHGENEDSSKTARKFAKYMMRGKIRSATQLLSRRACNGALNLDHVIKENSHDKTVREILIEKHPEAQEVHPDNVLPIKEISTTQFHDVLFESITGEEIRKSALKTEGAGGPSGVDAMSWRRLCTAFGDSSNDLCSALAAIAKRICTTHVDPSSLMAYTACRLIPLNKNPGVRPIGIGEVIRRIIGKVIMKIVKPDLLNAVGSLQLCAGQDAGCETAIHAMTQIFSQEDSEGTLFVDASNAFNALNRQTTLLNSEVICPALAPILINTYRSPSYMFVDGEHILSKEGTTQGDPLAMAMYAIGTLPLIQKLDNTAFQVWYADDSAASASLSRLQSWWKALQELGPSYGYFPNSLKTKLVIKEKHSAEAYQLFEGTGITILKEGASYLGGAFGSLPFIEESVSKKVKEWTEDLVRLSKFAETQPHAAYAALVHGLISKWNYFLRINDWESISPREYRQPLEDVISTQVIPSITGQNQLGDLARDLTALPINLGGLGIPNPVTTASEMHTSSKAICSPLIDSMMCQNSDLADINMRQRQTKLLLRSNKQMKIKKTAQELHAKLPTLLQRSMDMSQERGASTWLSALPLLDHGFALHKSAFRDALALRYNWPLKKTPSHCCCGQHFSVEHALSCPTGGFPSIRHNEVRDLTVQLLSEVCHGVSTEPHLQPVTEEKMFHRSANTNDNARLDVAMYGFWGGKFEKAFIDVRVLNPSAPSNKKLTTEAMYRKHELEKKETI